MEQEILKEIKKGIEEVAKDYLSGGLKKETAKAALIAIKEMAEMALKED